MSKRIEKVQKLARQVLGDIIHDLKDPRIGFATVTAVRVSPDLRHARVYISVLGDEKEQTTTMAGLESAKPHIRSELGHQMRMKYTPELVFVLDRVEETATRIEALIHKLHEEEGDR